MTIDVTEALAAIAALTVAVTAIGAAKLGPAGIMTAFRWATAAILK